MNIEEQQEQVQKQDFEKKQQSISNINQNDENSS